MQKLFYARRWGWKYGDVQLDREQVIALQGYPKDEQLVRLGFLAEADPRTTLCPCGVCGAEFLTPRALTEHGSKKHANRFATDVIRDPDGRIPAGEVAMAPPGLDPDLADERLQNEVAPIYYDRTKASRDNSDGVPHITSEPKVQKRKRGRPRKQHASV